MGKVQESILIKKILQIHIWENYFLLSKKPLQLWSMIRAYYRQENTGAIYSLAQRDWKSLGKINMKNQSPVP